MSTRSRYREECGHCTHVAHSVAEMERHLKTHADDKLSTVDLTGSTHQPSEDEQSESDSDICIRPDPEPEAEADNCLWEEWEADNVTFNYPRDVDDPNFEHHMGSCDTDMQHFRNLYHDSLSDDDIGDPSTEAGSPVSKSVGTSLADCGQSELLPHNVEHTTNDVLTEIDNSTVLRDISVEQNNSGPEIYAHLSDHLYSTPQKGPLLESHSQRRRGDSEHTSASEEGLHLMLPSSEDSDGEHSPDSNLNRAFSCAHCDFTSSVLSTVQQHTMTEHSEVPRLDTESATWECIDEAAVEQTDEQSDWQLIPDATEGDSDDDGPTPIEVAPIEDHEEERCFKCEINGCNTLFPLKVDFHNHVKLKHRLDGGQIFHCAYCWFAATDPERVKEHGSAAHPVSNQDSDCAIVSSDTTLSDIPRDNRIPLVVAPIENYGEVHKKSTKKSTIKYLLDNGQSTDAVVLTLERPFLGQPQIVKDQHQLSTDQHQISTDQPSDNNLNTMIMYECKVNGCPAVFFARDAFCYHVKNEHIHEGGRIFYCAYCQFAATDHVRVKEHAASEHTNRRGQPDLNLTPMQKKQSFKKLTNKTCCLFCKFSAQAPHVTVYHTYREHKATWMSQLEKMHPGFSKIAARLGILGALPLLKVPYDKSRVKQKPPQTTNKIITASKPNESERPLILRGGRRRRSAVNYAHLVNTGGMCEGCEVCDSQKSSKRQKVQEKEGGSVQGKNLGKEPQNSNSPIRKSLDKEDNPFPQSNAKPLCIDSEQKRKVVSHKQSPPSALINITVEPSKDQDSAQNSVDSVKGTATEKTATTEQVTKTLSKLTSLLKKPSSILAGHTVSKAKLPRLPTPSQPDTPANLEKQTTAQPTTVRMAPKPTVVAPSKPVLTQMQPKTANAGEKNNVMNIGVCNRGCTQHQILLLKNTDPNKTKVLLLHDFKGKVIHAESLQLSALGISMATPTPVSAPSASSVSSATPLSPTTTVRETPRQSPPDISLLSSDNPSYSPLEASLSSTSVLTQTMSPVPSPTVQIQDSAVSSTVSKEIKYESIDSDDTHVNEEELVHEEIDDIPFEDSVDDNAYLYADHEDLHWHGEESNSPATDLPFKRLTEEDHTSTTPSQIATKKYPKKRKKLLSTAIPMKRPAMKAVQSKEPTIQPTRVSQRERKPNLKCLCEDCKLHRILIDTRLQVGESMYETYEDRLSNDPKLKLKPVVLLPDILTILLKSR